MAAENAVLFMKLNANYAIGNTQNQNKKRQNNEHFGDVKRLVEKGDKSDRLIC